MDILILVVSHAATHTHMSFDFGLNLVCLITCDYPCFLHVTLRTQMCEYVTQSLDSVILIQDWLRWQEARLVVAIFIQVHLPPGGRSHLCLYLTIVKVFQTTCKCNHTH